MVNPDNTKINYIPSEEPETEQPQLAPVRSTIKSTKDFRRVLSKEEEQENSEKQLGISSKKKTPAKLFTDPDGQQETPEVIVQPSKDDEENASQLAAVSLFDLSKQGHKEKVTDQHPRNVVKESTAAESPNDLFKRMSKRTVKEFKSDENSSEINSQKTEHFTSRYAQEQPDLSYVNPLVGVQQSQATPIASTNKIEGPRTIDPAMQLLIEQVVKHMYTVDQKGKTDTVMTLQHPPLFKDAKIVVSAYDTAKGQFNISFENLTQAAQRILDMDENRRSLLLALEHKGYNIQIVATTTVQIQNIAMAERPSRDGQEDQQRQGSQQQDHPDKQHPKK